MSEDVPEEGGVRVGVEAVSVTLHKGDCLEMMRDISDGSIDMILCDLPYGTTQNKWDSIIPLDKLWREYSRITKETAAVVLTAQTPFDKALGASNLDWLKYEWIWEKEAGTGFLNAKKAPLKSHENVLVFYRSLPTYNPQMETGKPYNQKKGGPTANYNPDSKTDIVTVNVGERYPKTVLRFSRDKNKVHPTQKPVALMEYLIKTYTNVGEVVLDNCMGSGTTGVAALRLGRHFIGIEMDSAYFEIAEKRINAIVVAA